MLFNTTLSPWLALIMLEMSNVKQCCSSSNLLIKNCLTVFYDDLDEGSDLKSPKSVSEDLFLPSQRLEVVPEIVLCFTSLTELRGWTLKDICLPDREGLMEEDA